jgi:hypothetical protein
MLARASLIWLPLAVSVLGALCLSHPAQAAHGDNCDCCAPAWQDRPIKYRDPDERSWSYAHGWERLTIEHQEDRDYLAKLRRQRRERIDQVKTNCRRACEPCRAAGGTHCAGLNPLEPENCRACGGKQVRRTAQPATKCKRCRSGRAVEQFAAEPDARDYAADCRCPRPHGDRPSGTSFAHDGEW